jgi:hypothetical protein
MVISLRYRIVSLIFALVTLAVIVGAPDVLPVQF